jgi:hypothetical protein
MSVHAVLARPAFGATRGRHAKPGPTWPRVATRTLFFFGALISAGLIIGDDRPPALLVVPATALLLLVASVTKLRGAAGKIDTIFAEELTRPMRETVAEKVVATEIS